MLLRSNFSSFPHYFIYTFLTSGVKLHIHLLNVVVQFIVFLTLSTLICRSTDISKCFSGSLGIRDNESRLYLLVYLFSFRVTYHFPLLSSSWKGCTISVWHFLGVIISAFDKEKKTKSLKPFYFTVKIFME